MSVLKSRRTLSKFEFEHTFATFYQFSAERMASVAKRRHRWICWKMEVKLNKIFNELMEINEGYFEGDSKREKIDEIIKTAIENMLKIDYRKLGKEVEQGFLDYVRVTNEKTFEAVINHRKK